MTMVICLALAMIPALPVNAGFDSLAPAEPPHGESAAADQSGEPLPAGVAVRMGTAGFRHDGDVFGAVFEDDETLVSLGDDGLLRFWEMGSGKQLQKLPGCDGPHVLAISPDGSTLATASSGTIGLWKTRDTSSHVLSADTGEIASLAFSPDNKLLAAAGADGSVRLFDVAQGREIDKLKGHQGAVRSVAFSRDGNLLASAAMDGMVQVWDMATLKDPRRLNCRGELLRAVVFGADGKSVIAGGYSRIELGPAKARGVQHVWDPEAQRRLSQPIRLLGSLHIWELPTGRDLHHFEAVDQFDGVAALAISPDGKTLASGGIDKSALLWSVSTGKVIRKLQGGRDFLGEPYGMSFSPSGKIMASAGCLHTIYLWDVDTGQRLFNKSAVHEAGVYDVAISPDGRTAATAGQDGLVGIWDTATGRNLRMLSGHERIVRAVAFSRDGTVLASGGMDCTVRLWDLAAGTAKAVLPADKATVGQLLCVAISPNNQLIASAHKVGGPGSGTPTSTVLLRETASGKEICRLETVPGVISSMAFTPDTKALTVCATRALIRLEIGSFKEVFHLDVAGPGPHYRAPFSTDCRLLLVEQSLNQAAVWDLDARTEAYASSLPSGTSRCLALSSDGRLGASCYSATVPESYDQGQAISVWEVASGKELAHFDPPLPSGVCSAVFVPDGSRLVTGMFDSTVLVWKLLPEAGARPSTPATAGQMKSLWSDLAGNDVAVAYRAIHQLIAGRDLSVTFLRERLRPVACPDLKRAQQLLLDLDAKQYEKREAASKELAPIAEQLQTQIRHDLNNSPSPEARLRLASLLASAQGALPAGEMLRGIRAIQVLERIGTAESRSVLKSLGNGSADARQTREAKAALARMAGP